MDKKKVSNYNTTILKASEFPNIEKLLQEGAFTSSLGKGLTGGQVTSGPEGTQIDNGIWGNIGGVLGQMGGFGIRVLKRLFFGKKSTPNYNLIVIGERNREELKKNANQLIKLWNHTFNDYINNPLIMSDVKPLITKGQTVAIKLLNNVKRAVSGFKISAIAGGNTGGGNSGQFVFPAGGGEANDEAGNKKVNKKVNENISDYSFDITQNAPSLIDDLMNIGGEISNYRSVMDMDVLGEALVNLSTTIDDEYISPGPKLEGILDDNDKKAPEIKKRFNELLRKVNQLPDTVKLEIMKELGKRMEKQKKSNPKMNEAVGGGMIASNSNRTNINKWIDSLMSAGPEVVMQFFTMNKGLTQKIANEENAKEQEEGQEEDTNLNAKSIKILDIIHQEFNSGTGIKDDEKITILQMFIRKGDQRVTRLLKTMMTESKTKHNNMLDSFILINESYTNAKRRIEPLMRGITSTQFPLIVRALIMPGKYALQFQKAELKNRKVLLRKLLDVDKAEGQNNQFSQGIEQILKQYKILKPNDIQSIMSELENYSEFKKQEGKKVQTGALNNPMMSEGFEQKITALREVFDLQKKMVEQTTGQPVTTTGRTKAAGVDPKISDSFADKQKQAMEYRNQAASALRKQEAAKGYKPTIIKDKNTLRAFYQILKPLIPKGKDTDVITAGKNIVLANNFLLSKMKEMKMSTKARSVDAFQQGENTTGAKNQPVKTAGSIPPPPPTEKPSTEEEPSTEEPDDTENAKGVVQRSIDQRTGKEKPATQEDQQAIQQFQQQIPNIIQKAQNDDEYLEKLMKEVGPGFFSKMGTKIGKVFSGGQIA